MDGEKERKIELYRVKKPITLIMSVNKKNSFERGECVIPVIDCIDSTMNVSKLLPDTCCFESVKVKS